VPTAPVPVTVTLQTDEVETLARLAPSFHAWSWGDYAPDVRAAYRADAHSLLFAVRGDFNDDDKGDLALYGRDGATWAILVVLSTARGFMLDTLASGQGWPDDSVHRPRTTTLHLVPIGTGGLPHDGISIDWQGSRHADLMYLDRGRWYVWEPVD